MGGCASLEAAVRTATLESHANADPSQRIAHRIASHAVIHLINTTTWKHPYTSTSHDTSPTPFGNASRAPQSLVPSPVRIRPDAFRCPLLPSARKATPLPHIPFPRLPALCAETSPRATDTSRLHIGYAQPHPRTCSRWRCTHSCWGHDE